MADPIKLGLEIDLEDIKANIEASQNLNDNEQLFSGLTEVARAKKKLQDITDQLVSIETDVKGLINAKATSLYGPDWSAIKGKDYKITKSFYGPVFAMVGQPEKEFLVIKESLDSKKVKEFVKTTGKLPDGVDYTPERSSSIKITVSDED